MGAAPAGSAPRRCRSFGRLGCHQTTNAIATEAGVSPFTPYQFFSNKDPIATALASMYAREVAEAERAIGSGCSFSFTEAVGELIEVCTSFQPEASRVSHPRARRTALIFRARR
nr:TetR/AcrR family transcriptional regulator [Granulicella sp. L56]